MSGGKKEWETTLAKVGSTPQVQGGNNVDNNDYNDGYIDDNNEDNFDGEPDKNSMQLIGSSKGMNTLDDFSDKGLVQRQSGDPHTDKDWADLEGKERWNLVIYSRSDHPIEFEWIKVKLSLEITNKTIQQNGNTRETISTKKSLQEVVSWLIDKYTGDASAITKGLVGLDLLVQSS